MKTSVPTFFATPAAFKKWLTRNAASASELIVGFYKVGSGHPSITWPQAVDEALCVGWIDAVRKRIDDESYLIRFTPRKTSSHWSAVNIDRVAVLTKRAMKIDCHASPQKIVERSAIQTLLFLQRHGGSPSKA